MAHQLVLVLIRNPHAKVAAQVGALLDRHSMHAAVEPYKEYFEPCHWNRRLWEEGDAEEFVRLRAQALGEKYHRDEKGFYQWADSNREGHYDWHTLRGRWDGIFAGLFEAAGSDAGAEAERVEGNICPVAALPQDLFPTSIVTPDGTWHFFGWRFGGEDPDAQNIARIREIAREYSGYYAVAVDAHS